MELRTILVGIDGSTNSLDAVSWTAGLARATGAEVVALHVVGLLDRLDPEAAPVPSEPNRDQIRERFEGSWTAALDEADVRHRHLLRDGTPVVALLDVADQIDADLIVVGSRGVGANTAALLGSTSAQLVQEAGRPVTIIPPRGGRLASPS